MNKSFILGTLGNNIGCLSCSMYVGNKKYVGAPIRGYPKYEEALIDLKSETISALLIPAAYPRISNFIMDEEIVVQEVFVEPIPPLVLVTQNTCHNLERINRIYLHPATNKLLDEVFCENDTKEIIYVDSNIDACEQLVKDNCANTAAITNALCANHYNLHVERVLRKNVNMPWVLFEKIGKELNSEIRH